jgi:hypothetical protein
MTYKENLMKRIATLLCTGLLCITIACTTAQVTSVITGIDRFTPVVTNVLALACDFNQKAALCSTGAATLNKDAADLTSALSIYEAKVTAGTATSADWNVANAVFQTFEADSASIFELFHISNASSEATANAVAASAQTLLAVIEALFPSAPAPVAVSTARMERPAKFSASLPAAGVAGFSLSVWQKDYNKRVDMAKKAHPQAKLAHIRKKLL